MIEIKKRVSGIEDVALLSKNEKFKEIKNTDGNYFISNYGRVWCTGFIQTDKLGRRHYTKPGFVGYSSGNGYKCVQIRRRSMLIHRLVGQYFLHKKNIQKCINHKDLNKQNNHYKNLEWCTHRENNIHAIKNGARSCLGDFENIFITNFLISRGRNLDNHKLLSSFFGVSETRIRGIARKNLGIINVSTKKNN